MCTASGVFVLVWFDMIIFGFRLPILSPAEDHHHSVDISDTREGLKVSLSKEAGMETAGGNNRAVAHGHWRWNGIVNRQAIFSHRPYTRRRKPSHSPHDRIKNDN